MDSSSLFSICVLRDILGTLIVSLAGGERLLHPELLAFVAEAASRPEIVRVSVSTNGLELLSEPALLEKLHKMDVCISLQLDGFEENAYEVLRGRPLLREKLAILRLLKEESITTSLTMTAAGGVNEDPFHPMLDQLFAHEHIVSLMIQPAALGHPARRHRDRESRADRREFLGGAPMMGPPRGSILFFVLLATVVGVAPPALYWLVFDRVPQVTPKEAVELLRRSNPPALLVNVRPAAEFQTGHVEGPATGFLGQRPRSGAVIRPRRGAGKRCCCSAIRASASPTARISSG